MRHFAALGMVAALLPVALLFVGISPAQAAGAGVSFVRRDYDLQIQRNGDVVAAEHWQVHFSGGPYSNATLGVFLTHAQSVDFDSVTGADPNSEHVAKVEDNQGHEFEQVKWTFPVARDETRTFTIPYTLHEAIGHNTTQAWLDRHFFDGPGRGNFPVAATRVTVTLPATGGDVQVKSDYAGAPLQVSRPSNTTIALDGQNLNSEQLLEVEVVFPRTQLDAGAPRPAWQQGDTPPTPPTQLDRVVPEPPVSSSGPTNPIEAFFGNVGLVLAVGLVIVAILGFVGWRLTRRLASDLHELVGERAEAGGGDGDDEAMPAITRVLPAIDLNFGEVQLPKRDEELDLSALGLHSLDAGEPAQGAEGTSESNGQGKTQRGTGATSGVGSEGAE